jgi:hypothetical protein
VREGVAPFGERNAAAGVSVDGGELRAGGVDVAELALGHTVRVVGRVAARHEIADSAFYVEEDLIVDVAFDAREAEGALQVLPVISARHEREPADVGVRRTLNRASV